MIGVRLSREKHDCLYEKLVMICLFVHYTKYLWDHICIISKCVYCWCSKVPEFNIETCTDNTLLAGTAVGMKNFLRITFAIEPAALEVGLERLKAFYERHAKIQ